MDEKLPEKTGITAEESNDFTEVLELFSILFSIQDPIKQEYELIQRHKLLSSGFPLRPCQSIA